MPTPQLTSLLHLGRVRVSPSYKHHKQAVGVMFVHRKIGLSALGLVEFAPAIHCVYIRTADACLRRSSFGRLPRRTKDAA